MGFRPAIPCQYFQMCASSAREHRASHGAVEGVEEISVCRAGDYRTRWDLLCKIGQCLPEPAPTAVWNGCFFKKVSTYVSFLVN